MRIAGFRVWSLATVLALVGCQSRFTGTTMSIDSQCQHGFPDEAAISRVLNATLDDRGGTGYNESAVRTIIGATGGVIVTYANARLELPDTALSAGWSVPYLEPTKIAIANDGGRGAHNYYVFLQTGPGSKPLWYSFHSTDTENVCIWIPI